MAKLNKLRNGLITRIIPGNTFESPWILENKQALSYKTSSIDIQSPDFFQALYSQFWEDATITIHYEFLPTENDQAGLTYFFNSEYHIRVAVLHDNNTAEPHRWLRLKKTGHLIEAFASKNGSDWSFVGGTIVDYPGYLGIYAENPNSNFKLLDVSIANSLSITVEDLPTGAKAELWVNGELFQKQDEHSSMIEFDVSELPLTFDGEIKVKDYTGHQLASFEDPDMAAGDAYSVRDSLDLWVNDVEVLHRHDFGLLPQNLIDYKVRLQNNLDFKVKDVRVKVIENPGQFGYQWVSLSEDTDPLVFENYIELGDFEIGEEKTCIMRIARELDALAPHELETILDCSFLLNIIGG